MSPVLEIRDLSVDLPLHRGLAGLWSRGVSLNILRDISLTLSRGEALGIVGESGSGKTTLARAIMGLQRRSGGGLRFEGQALTTDFTPIRTGAALMFQDPVGALSPRMTVGRLIAEPLAIQRRNGPAPEAFLARVGLPPDFVRRYPHQLSGGQARRVGLARALAQGSRLILADEPTAGLDVSVQGEVLNLMSALKAEDGLALMVISHNLAMLRHVSDRIAVLYLGRLMETGPAAEVFARPAHPYTRSLIAAEPQPDPRKRRADLALKGEIPSLLRRPTACAFHTRCPHAFARCRVEEPALRVLSADHAIRCHLT